MTAAAALRCAEAAGVRFRLAPDGSVRMEAATPPPANVLAALTRWRDDVAHLLALRQALTPTEHADPVTARAAFYARAMAEAAAALSAADPELDAERVVMAHHYRDPD